MKFYLSSYKLGDEVEKLKKLVPKDNNKTAFIPNALDFSTELERKKRSDQADIDDLTSIGLDVELLDLRAYFDQQNKLEKKIAEFGVIWVRGGNTFILRQAMKLSGFDVILKKLLKKDNILYGGYSAGICVLSPSLKGTELIDDVNAKPYGDKCETIWTGLNIINYSIAPHYKSNHPESEDVDKEVDYFIKNKIPYKALKDGEVIIIE